MSKRRKRLLIVAAAVIIVGGAAGWYFFLYEPVYPFTISRETTYLLGPLHADGKTLNYVAALNEMTSRGVTPDNNAAVLVAQALGPEIFDQKVREQSLKAMGIGSLTQPGERFVSLTGYLIANPPAPVGKTASGSVSWPRGASSASARTGPPPTNDPSVIQGDNLQAAMKATWSAQDYPVLASWLKANDKPLDLLVLAASRPRWWIPRFSATEPPATYAAAIFSFGGIRDACRALTARAMLKAGSGRLDEAWSDLLACHRLNRLLSQGCMLIELMLGASGEGSVCAAEHGIAVGGALSASQGRQSLADLDALPVRGDIAGALSWDRFVALDIIGGAYRQNRGSLRVRQAPPVGKLPYDFPRINTDWDRAMRVINVWYDRQCQAVRQESFAARKLAWEDLHGQASQLLPDDPSLQAKRSGWFIKWFPGQSDEDRWRKQFSRHPGELLVVTRMPSNVLWLKLPCYAEANFQTTRVAFALAACKAERGRYPESLDALVPEYLKEMPRDAFVDQPLKYQRQGGGYLLYSVGPNMKDDSGACDWSKEGGPDDVAVIAK